MKIEPISDDSKKIINTMRDSIARGLTEQSNKTMDGWRYVGDEFIEIVESLHQSMQKELESKNFNVVGCTVRHFSRGANIQNPNYPTKRLLIIPINGTSTLTPPGGQIPPGSCCYIKNTPTLSGEGIDVVFIVFEAEQDAS